MVVDKQTVALMIPVMALAIPVVAIVFSSMVKIARLRVQSQVSFPPEIDHRIAALEDEVGTLRRELGETQERLDFTERLLIKKTEEQRQLDK
jgi:hypothetical protein